MRSLLVAAALLCAAACGDDRTIAEKVRSNDADAVEDWIDAGGDLRTRAKRLLIEATGPKGGDEVLRVLLDAGADANAGNGAPLDNAADWGDLEACRLLVARGASPFITTPKGTALDRMSNRHALTRPGDVGDFFREHFKQRGQALLDEVATLEKRHGHFVTLPLDVFFGGNTHLGSIGCNLNPHPGLAVFYATLKALEERGDVQAVLLSASADADARETGWPFCEALWVLTRLPAGDVDQALAALQPSAIREGWVTPVGNPPKLGPGMQPIWVWWD